MIAYFLALLIGISLGLLGGGGSILTVPILVYAVGMDAKLSIALSLAIVGFTSLVGVFGHLKNKNVDFKTALIFAPFAMVGTFFGARLSQFISAQAQLVLFSIIMLLASIFMMRGQGSSVKTKASLKPSLKFALVALEGLFVGVLTGIVGVGGGFLIVPALVLLGGLSMKKAVGTSLFIISLKSFSGFLGYLELVEIPWMFLGKFTLFSSLGILIGSFLVSYVSQKALKKLFAWFLILMGVFMLYKNLF